MSAGPAGGDRGVQLVSVGRYLPAHRLEPPPGARGAAGVPGRAVAAHDEDTTTMGVEAARAALDGQRDPGRLLLATSRPAYERKTNAAVVRAALDLPPETLAVDVTGGEQAAASVLRDCATGGGLAVMSDLVVARPGAPDEAAGSDGAAALLFAEAGGGALARVLGAVSLGDVVLDRWRLPGERFDRVWNGRFVPQHLRTLGRTVAERLLGETGAGAPDLAVVACVDKRVAAAIAGATAARWFVDLDPDTGYAGLAHAGLLITRALEETRPGERFAAVCVGDGASAVLFERGPAELPPRAGPRRDPQAVSYVDYLAWRGLLERDQTSRPPPAAPALPAMTRNAAWKYALIGSRCSACGTVHAPPARVCTSCRALDRMEPYRLSHRRARVATFTEDHLAWGMRKPVVSAILDFDGGGRFESEVTDPVLADLRVGAVARMVFRRAFTAEGVHNYGWKATVHGGGEHD